MVGIGLDRRAATWLKIVYWHHDQTLTPLETILKAYDDMPNVPLPYFMLAPQAEPASLRTRWARLLERLRFK